MIRTAQPQDAIFVTDLAHEFDVFSPVYVEVFQGFFQAQMGSFFVCEDHTGQRMGFAQVQWTDAEGDIQGVVVVPKLRRKGVANQLLDHIKQLARDRGVLSLKCITAETANPGALLFFTNRGFINEGFRGLYPIGQRAVSLRLTLN